MKESKYLKLIFTCCFMFIVYIATAQLPADMSRVKSADVSDAQLREFVQKAQASGQTETQLFREFSRRGMPTNEINILRSRMVGLQNNVTLGNTTPLTVSPREVMNKSSNSATNPTLSNSLIFGSELFSNPNLSFEPDLRIPTPKNYVLGPDDKLLLDVFGVNLSQQELRVSPEGNIYIKYAGPLQVSGLTIEEASRVINKKLAKFYPAIASGKTSAQITLTGIRSIKVVVIGAIKKPGTYNLTSLATLFNALYVSGGPTENGSFRNIELVRNNKIITKADLYEFLMNTSQKANVRLMDNDVIKIPFVKTKVHLSGEVNREGFYEIQPNETLENAIDFAGGYTSNAFKARITGVRNTDFEKKIIDISKEEIQRFNPQNGDEFEIGNIIDKFQNRLTIVGSVFKPGNYALEKDLTLEKLIQKAHGLTEDAFTKRAIITRTREDLTKEYISVDLLSDSAKLLVLQKEDIVNVSSIFDIKENFKVTINGEVQHPGEYQFEDSLSLKSLILLAGGYTDDATGMGIEIARRKRNVDVNNPKSPIVEIININGSKDLSKLSNDLILSPFDNITIKKDPYYKKQIQVLISGEVLHPGAYTLTSRSEKISDLIKRAGSLLYTADLAGAKLIRRNYYANTDLELIEKIAASSAKDSSGVILKQEAKPYKEVAIALTEVIDNPGSKDDILLEEGDQIIIPQVDNMVTVAGEIFKPLAISYESSKKLKDYINDAGGLTASGNKKKIFVVYPNGKAATTKHIFLFFKKYPEITAGSKIFVPKEAERKPSDYSKVGVIISTFSALITTMALVYQITK